ncbi:MAG: response regulator [Desulfovibrionaceae bacterium]|jgi:ATP-dependent Lon protease|nr:response regulator [Desulfovibrionaceae bacterium]
MALFRRSNDTADDGRAEGATAKLRARVEGAGLPQHVHGAALSALDQLDKTDPAAAEYGIGLNYVEFLLSLPWNAGSEDNFDLARAEEIMNREHYGLARVKERMLEYLASGIVSSKRPLRVLVVDDEKIARENTVYALQKEGWRVEAASDGQEAKTLFSSGPVDLVITDLKMQKVDGIQLLEWIKQGSPRTKLILVTGYATVDTAVDALRKGAAHYLPKPLNLDTLRRTAREALADAHHERVARGPILCFTGPPGTGKTSIGRAVAEALERRFIRLSMAGLRDEAELRGHRRTYVGAMAGRIITEIRRVGVNNPVFMLDEIDKIGQDFRGDPASVMLEILDPEQNRAFLDYYLDIPFDLSRVMFITTANMPENLPAPLLDRMEMIPFPSYTLGEKRRIGQEYILPRAVERHGHAAGEIVFTDAAMDALIRDHTRGAGVRSLEREIGSVLRKINRRFLQEKVRVPLTVEAPDVAELLGPPAFAREAAEGPDLPGVTTGLVWSETGGHIIFIETARMRGTGQLIMTGSLGEVLQESARTALSHLRSNAAHYGVDEGFLEGSDIHVHIPAGAIPKDGPSAGLTIAMALLSLLTGRPARRDAALTGEFTLSGRVLPVGGIREKILAAQQAGARVAVFPRGNEAHVARMDPEVRNALELVFVDSLDEAAEVVLGARGE